jgi:hypothetical protein
MSNSIVIPAKAGTQTLSSGLFFQGWAPAFGVPAKYYFAGCPFAGVTGGWS